MQCDVGLVSMRGECDGHDGFNTAGPFRHPRVFKLVRPFDQEKASVMWPRSSFVLDCQIEKPSTIGFRITRSAPNHGPPGLFGSIQTSNTFSADAGIVRVMVCR